ncbi:endonuclease Q family protein [Gracilibacillus sp. D59]|uniref:endonuclease Q family protein n=1 Tax=Gracilibacillus sp. D59 TaxID=3457434 RepID=UPI003FCC3D3D
MLKEFFTDLHIHIGRNSLGKPVKITASKNLTLMNIMQEASERKGLDIVGIIDCHAPTVLNEIELAVSKGVASELVDGGIQFGNTTLILGSEIEVYDENCKGPIHVLCFFPFLKNMKEFSRWLSFRMKNIELSSQRYYGDTMTLQTQTHELDGLFIPAHVFTPFKSLFGKGVSHSLTEVLDPNQVDAIELGLSSDTKMADQIKELHQYTFLTNSDSHSLPKIAREYQLLLLAEPSFKELKMALKNEYKRRVMQNFGMNPKLGKYFATVCANCLAPFQGKYCSKCGSTKFVKGVSDRIQELASKQLTSQERPDYIYQVPLEYLPKLGPKTLEKLLSHFGNEMNIIHYVPKASLAEVVGENLATMILDLRQGKLMVDEGGGGRYGRVKG